MNASVSATFSAFCACSSTSSTAAARVAQLEDRLHHRVGRERREAERGLVGDEHLRRVGERGREAEHLLLAAGEQAGDLLAPLREDREPRRRPCSRSSGSRSSTVRFSSTVRPGKMPRASGTRSTPSRARWYDGACGDVAALEHAPCRASASTTPGRDRAQRRLAGAVGAEQRDDLAGVEREVDAVEHLDVAVAGDDAVHRERRAGERVAVRRPARRLQRRRRSRGRCSCSGTAPSCAAASAAAIARLAAPSRASSRASAGRRARGCRRAPARAGSHRGRTGSARSRPT